MYRIVTKEALKPTVILYEIEAPMVAKKAQGEHSNLIMGFYNATKSLGGIIGSLVAGFIYTRGPKLAFVFAGIVLLVATLFSVVYRRMRDSGPTEQAGD